MTGRTTGFGTDEDAERWMGVIASAAEVCTGHAAEVRRLADSTDKSLHVSVSCGKRSMGIRIDYFGFSSAVVLELGRRLVAERLADARWAGMWIYAVSLAEKELILAEEDIDIDDYR